MVDKISSTQGITRMIADICLQVEENSLRDKQSLKDEIRSKKGEMKEAYGRSANTQGWQGINWETSGCITGAVILTSAFVPEPYQKLAQMIPEIGSNITRGIDSHLSGDVTRNQGQSSLEQKEMEFLHTKLQDAGNEVQKAQRVFEEALSSEKHAITQG